MTEETTVTKEDIKKRIAKKGISGPIDKNLSICCEVLIAYKEELEKKQPWAINTFTEINNTLNEIDNLE